MYIGTDVMWVYTHCDVIIEHIVRKSATVETYKSKLRWNTTQKYIYIIYIFIFIPAVMLKPCEIL